jgi:hypothetical protein
VPACAIRCPYNGCETRSYRRFRLPALNHFEIIESFADSSSPINAAVLGHIARSS